MVPPVLAVVLVPVLVPVLAAAPGASPGQGQGGEEAIQCPPCSEERLARCKAPQGCAELVREPGCGCCATCALGRGTACGVYTARCGAGLRCYPPRGVPRPLHTLMHGQGVCTDLADVEAIQESLQPPGKALRDAQIGECVGGLRWHRWGWGDFGDGGLSRLVSRELGRMGSHGWVASVVTHGAVVVVGGTVQPQGRTGTGCTRCCGAPCLGSRCWGSSRCAVTPELSLPRDAAGTAGRKQERGRGAPASLANRSCPAQGLRVLPPPAPRLGRAVPSQGPQGLQPRCLQALLVHPTALSLGSIVTPCHPCGAQAGSGAARVVWQSERTPPGS